MNDKTTETEVSIMVTVQCRCPCCGQRIVIKDLLTEESLSTGNTTQQASYAIRLWRERIEADKARRGWSKDQCGKCRDSE